MNPVLHSSARHDWLTPSCVLELVRKVGPIGLDPCAPADNPTGAAAHYTGVDGEDGLSLSWSPNDFVLDGERALVFCNPPYARALPLWIDKAIAEAAPHDEGARRAVRTPIIVLVPARPDTAWWSRATNAADARCLWRGRLTFRGAPAPAPFPSALFFFGARPYRFADVFQGHGEVAVLRPPR